MVNTAIQSSTAATVAATTGRGTGTANANTEDRFLKLLVAQMQNQDPLNPMDNAQVTTQMAQIQTVAGIDKLTGTVQGLNAQFAQLQALGAASLVGRNVLIEGNRMIAADGSGHAGYELASQADRVKLEVLDRAGRVIDTQELGAEASGRHSFDWTPSAGVDAAQAARFRITATLGTTAVAATPYTVDRVDAVSTDANGVILELAHAGPVAYDEVKAFD
ncbi:MAG: flagellar hook assembly protein FlgD [Ideonella sp.]|nr:flagellar hook assembly protein FlgD [Ideonella sp.]